MSVFIYRYSKIVLQTELPCVIIIKIRCVALRDAPDTFFGMFRAEGGENTAAQNAGRQICAKMHA